MDLQMKCYEVWYMVIIYWRKVYQWYLWFKRCNKETVLFALMLLQNFDILCLCIQSAAKGDSVEILRKQLTEKEGVIAEG